MFCSLSVLSHMSSEIREFNKDHGCMSSTLVVLPYHPVSFSAITASGTTFLPKSLYITFYGSRLPSRVTNLASSLTWLFQSQSYTLVFQVYIPFPFFQGPIPSGMPFSRRTFSFWAESKILSTVSPILHTLSSSFRGMITCCLTWWLPRRKSLWPRQFRCLIILILQENFPNLPQSAILIL